MPPTRRHIAVTGHRPDKLGGYSQTVTERIYQLAHGWLAVQLGSFSQLYPTAIISGLALGWDTACAKAALDLGIPLIAAIPFPTQPSKWPPSDIAVWKSLRDKATETHVISPTYSRAAFQRRNEWMVDNCDEVLALWNGSAGGTNNCIKYARLKRVYVDNIWPSEGII